MDVKKEIGKIEKTRGILNEFKEFISRGNVIDLAVGIIIGSAFTAIVNSLVTDIIMPVIGVLSGGVDFKNLKIVLKAGDEAAKINEVAIHYGTFIEKTVDFLLIAVVVFAMVKLMNRFRRKKEGPKAAEPPKRSEEVVLLAEIRDLLKK